MSATNYSNSLKEFISSYDSWKKFIHTYPALYNALENNGTITVGEFLKIKSCAETTYDQLPLSVRALHCLDWELSERKSVSDILSMPLARLAGLRNAGVKTVREILDAVAAYARQDPPALIDTHPKNFLMLYTEQIAKEQWDVIEAQLESDEQREVLLKIMDIAEVIGADMVAFPCCCHRSLILFENRKYTIRKQKSCKLW